MEGHTTKCEQRLVSVIDELSELAFQYSWDEICEATEQFSEARCLGAGACGSVFRGTLREGTDVAVKVIEGHVGGGFEEEVRLLSRCRHPNVVMLLGFAQAPAGKDGASSRRALVYELLQGGDLHAKLHSAKSCQWQERLQAAIDVTRGLSHLHKHRPEIFHRDIKPANILFGRDGVARIADFGLSCISKHHSARELTVEVASGTAGYADPLYAQSSLVTEASEVYSMGMVLLEILTGRPPAIIKPDGSYRWLAHELLPYSDGAKQRILGALDPRAGWPRTTATTLINLTLLCIHEDSDQRPSFLDLAALLKELADHAAVVGSPSKGRSELNASQKAKHDAALHGRESTCSIQHRSKPVDVELSRSGNTASQQPTQHAWPSHGNARPAVHGMVGLQMGPASVIPGRQMLQQQQQQQKQQQQMLPQHSCKDSEFARKFGEQPYFKPAAGIQATAMPALGCHHLVPGQVPGACPGPRHVQQPPFVQMQPPAWRASHLQHAAQPCA
eukprot:TRINITY_DN3518_c1_g1_i1.p1 TRINITY_DN3518_c1_g1~~TRINITY_DN3518_c1_g1_i1.p1  ORF type:complete len:503 (+),score=98.11 TRINITY_DN3518_c1_g1_i1:146-1654(+)